MTEQEMRAEICVGLGGQVAERMLFGDISVGAYGDLQQVNTIARAMVEQYGMSAMGARVVLQDEAGKANAALAGARQTKVDDEIDRILREETARCTELLTTNKGLHQALVTLLLDKKVLDINDIASFNKKTDEETKVS